MVSLIGRWQYRDRINESPKLTAFNDLLLGKDISLPDPNTLKEVDKIYFAIVQSIQANNKRQFEAYYNIKSRSNPSKDYPSPFVNDDFLIFCIILGIAKFRIDKNWIRRIISIRSQDAFTITLENIINENYYSKSNLSEVILMFFKLYDQRLITNEFLTTTYGSIVGNVSLFESKSDFHILCSMISYDLIIELKGAMEGSEVSLLKKFNGTFLRRMKVMAWIVQTILLVCLLYVGVELISEKAQVKAIFDKIGSVLKMLGLIGISQLGNVFPTVKKKLFQFMLLIFGYPKALISSVNDNNKSSQ